ncbi:hypothetical protein CWI42_080090 [Ordospora colligata]|uniref:WD40 domain-containing protein n=1 Tax=Ordospora colligata OC4 TaxID=1354746 RepID=A0A0B2UDZ6_9MICR|nr:uncharacterized protein M896_080090 [Ordospora colligata OC4]KHN69276.1 hypothetical protein M896_080090 [Ordospora colligata OC4]TBU15092.1 hypothetical protein CWI41_080100 [Ordospora colligata]TBU15143.1 hypothetical protein CWI40_080100 [Ordospora colligata]TBU18389.1 hypothetical protein CWI42_080090 [Ordospora colligata]
MGFLKIAERKLTAVPTDLWITESKLYVSMKKNHLVETTHDMLRVRYIRLKENARTIVGCEDDLFIFSEKGSISSLNVMIENAREEVKKGNMIVNSAVYDKRTKSIITGTNKGKVLVMKDGLEVSKRMYESQSGVVSVSVSSMGMIACAYQIDSVIRVFDMKSSDVRNIKIPSGFPQAVCFEGQYLAIGSDKGVVYLVDELSLNVIKSLSIPSAVTSLFFKNGRLIVGAEGFLYLMSVKHGVIEIIDSYCCNGVVNMIGSSNDFIVIITGKEGRLGRWTINKNWENKVEVLKMN